jgi:hypothetical protein
MIDVWRGGPVPSREWLEHEDLKLRRDWMRGVKSAVIADDLGRTKSDVIRRRIALGLPVRRHKAAGQHLSCTVEEAMLQAVRRRARERSQTVSEYLRSLIRRDLGNV